MTRPLLLLLLTGACARPEPPSAAAQASAAAPSVEAALLASDHVGLYDIVGSLEECSGLGGTHLTLRLLTPGWGRPPEAVGAGGHGSRFSVPLVVSGNLEAMPPGVVRTPLYAVASVTPTRRTRRVNTGWCLHLLPPVEGVVDGSALPIADLADALTWELYPSREQAAARLQALQARRAGR